MMKDDIPVAVYSGTDMEAMFLKSLLKGSDIPASVSDLSFRGDVDVRVCVAQRDVERARPIVDHFKEHGKKTPPPFKRVSPFLDRRAS